MIGARTTTRHRTSTRRAIICTGIVAGGAIALSGGGYPAYREATEPISSVGSVDVDTRLTYPPLIEP